LSYKVVVEAVNVVLLVFAVNGKQRVACCCHIWCNDWIRTAFAVFYRV